MKYKLSFDSRRSIAGHHKECPNLFDDCACEVLYEQSTDKEDDEDLAYSYFYDPDHD